MNNTTLAGLLRSRRFLPFFLTQALGAFNDNIFKNVLLLLFTFSAAERMGVDINLLVNLAAGLFILPFFLFSPIAGQFADKYEKSVLIRRIKFIEIVIMVLAAIAFVYQSWWTLLLLLFCMGVQSAFFGPIKYAILPQHLDDSELVGGNALVEMATFLAILGGTIFAGILANRAGAENWAALFVVLFAVLGYLTSRKIPSAEAAAPHIKINWNPATELVSVWRQLLDNRPVLLSIMAISWFWFMGASYLTQFPNFAKQILFGDTIVVTLLLTLFSVGIAIGSLLCERLSAGRVELGVVPIGAVGITLFGIDLALTANALPSGIEGELRGLGAFLSVEGAFSLMFSLCMIGVSGGLFIVPLYAIVQQRTDKKSRAQIIAANNVMNAAFMVGSALFAIIFLNLFSLSITDHFLVISIMNLVVSLYVFQQVPEFLLRFVIWIFSHTMYRVTSKNLDEIPDRGPAVLICNHVSYVDALIIGGAVKRPVRFVMDRGISQMPGMKYFFRFAKTIPICAKHKDPEVYERAFESIHEVLQQGELVCIFPEGKLTHDGHVAPFKRGIEKIIERDPVPVVPLALSGLWGSWFSHKDGRALTTRPKRFWSKIGLEASQPVAAEAVTAEGLETIVKDMLGEGV